MKNILILEKNDYSKKALLDYKKIGHIIFFTELTEQKKIEALAKANILVVRLAQNIDTELIERMPNLELVVSPTTGLNHLDLEFLKRKKIKVISLKGQTSFLKNITATAEITFGLMISLVRNIPWAFDDVKAGNWNREAWKGHQLSGKVLGLVGCGRLGKIVAGYGRAFKMNVVAADPRVSKKTMKRYGVKKVSIEDLFGMSDIISVHVNLEKETEKMIGKKLFSTMMPHAYFINTSRGEIIDEDALLSVLSRKKIAGAALDVLVCEIGLANTKTSKLVEYAGQHKNLIIVPHIGGAALEAMHATEEFTAGLVLKHYKYE